MATVSIGDHISDLLESEQYDQARALLEKELKKEPDSHWLLTQLAEAYYEQRHYKKALALLLRSLEIVPDCPLTLWHLAGTVDALGYPAGALRLYTWLLECKKTPQDDPCWESAEWTDALKTDCLFRMGVCFQHLHRKEKAQYCFRQYIDLLMAGARGSYPVEEALQHLRDGRRISREAVEDELRKAADWVVRASGEKVSSKPPQLDRKKLRQLQEA